AAPARRLPCSLRSGSGKRSLGGAFSSSGGAGSQTSGRRCAGAGSSSKGPKRGRATTKGEKTAVPDQRPAGRAGTSLGRGSMAGCPAGEGGKLKAGATAGGRGGLIVVVASVGAEVNRKARGRSV